MIPKCTLLLVAAALAVAGPGCVRDTAMNGRVAAPKAGISSGSEIAPSHRPVQAKSAQQLGRNFAEVDDDLQTGVLAGILRYVRRAGGARRSVQAQGGAARAELAGSAVMLESAALSDAGSTVRFAPADSGRPALDVHIKRADRAGAVLAPGRGGRNYTPLDPLDRNS